MMPIPLTNIIEVSLRTEYFFNKQSLFYSFLVCFLILSIPLYQEQLVFDQLKLSLILLAPSQLHYKKNIFIFMIYHKKISFVKST